ncbi:hypothetical protein [Acidocella sp.]|jgi:hypothetical protein|uniref:hypothetical protein n=1 Tax=Acidocella sp. TaxID=50710 RepID=UPI002F3E66C1
MTATTQNNPVGTSSAPTAAGPVIPDDMTTTNSRRRLADLATAVRELSWKIDGQKDGLSEGLARLGYSTTTIHDAVSESRSAIKLLGEERRKLAEIVAMQADVRRQKAYVGGALAVGLVIGLVVSPMVAWLYNALTQ